MTELVESQSEDGQAGDEQQLEGVAEDLAGPLEHLPALGGEQPAVEADQPGQDGDDQRRPEQRPQRSGGAPMEPLGQDPSPETQGQERIGTSQGGIRPAGLEEPEGLQLGLDEVVDVVRADRPAEIVGNRRCDLGGVACAVEQRGDQVQQPGDLDDLPVASPQQVLGLLKAEPSYSPSSSTPSASCAMTALS